MTPEELKKNNQKVRMKQKRDAKAKLKENEAKEWQTIEKKGIIPKKQPKKKEVKPDDEEKNTLDQNFKRFCLQPFLIQELLKLFKKKKCGGNLLGARENLLSVLMM